MPRMKRTRAARGGPAAKKLRYRGSYSAAQSALRSAMKSGDELKFLDCAWNGVALAASTDGSGGELQPSSGSTNNLSTPAVGDTESARDGRTFTLWSAWVSGLVDWTALSDQADGQEAPSMFFGLVLDTQANGATINSEDVFENPSTNAYGMLPQPVRNLANTKRFKVLAAQFIEPADLVAFTDGTNTGSVVPCRSAKVNLSYRFKKGLKVRCTGTTADIASVADNAIHLVAFASSTAYTPTFVGKSRVRFTG